MPELANVPTVHDMVACILATNGIAMDTAWSSYTHQHVVCFSLYSVNSSWSDVLWLTSALVVQVEEEDDINRLEAAMEHAIRASEVADVAGKEHNQALAAVDTSRQRLLQLQDVKAKEAANCGVAAAQLTAKRSELSVLHATLVTTSQQQQAQLAQGAVQAAARLDEAKQVMRQTAVVLTCPFISFMSSV